jgi:hypothetical protein
LVLSSSVENLIRKSDSTRNGGIEEAAQSRLRKAIQLLGSILGRKNISSPNDRAYFADTFVRRGCEYYASARFATHAGQL